MDDTGNRSETPKQYPLALGQRSVVILFVYYIILLIISALSAVAVKIEWLSTGLDSSLLFCIFLSAVGATVFYSRKLYKACISGAYNFQNGSYLEKIGTFFFFALRPIFAAVFAWIAYMIWSVAIISSVDEFRSFSNTHFYFSGIIGFFIGFLTGRVLTRFEHVGERYMEGI